MSVTPVGNGMQPPESPPADAGPPEPPVVPLMARRTYMCLRLGAVGVIAILFASLIKEYNRAGHCLQGSISAFYYTPVQSVFVGALTAMGLVMIVLWGKTPWEDGALNLAGLVAPVVAFVPTANTNKCGLPITSSNEKVADRQQDQVIQASHDAIFNNVLSYVVIVGLILLILLAVGIIAHVKTHWAVVTYQPLAYWGPWVVAMVLWLVGTYRFWQDREWFYANAHKWAAITLFAFIIVAVVDIGYQRWPREGHPDREPAWFWERFFKKNPDPRVNPYDKASKRWAVSYWALATIMVIGAAAIQLGGKHISHDFDQHHTFFVEAWMIGWLAIFWLLQTWDRRNDGAPPATPEEQAHVATAAAQPAVDPGTDPGVALPEAGPAY